MTFDEYQEAAATFAVYPKDREREYLALGLISEVGELAGKVKKEIRDGVDLTDGILGEVGDCAWYASQIIGSSRASMIQFVGPIDTSTVLFATDAAMVLEIAATCLNDNMPAIGTLSRMLYMLHIICCRRSTTLEAVCEANISKLRSRQERGKLGGSGDNR